MRKITRMSRKLAKNLTIVVYQIIKAETGMTPQHQYSFEEYKRKCAMWEKAGGVKETTLVLDPDGDMLLGEPSKKDVILFPGANLTELYTVRSNGKYSLISMALYEDRLYKRSSIVMDKMFSTEKGTLINEEQFYIIGKSVNDIKMIATFKGLVGYLDSCGIKAKNKQDVITKAVGKIGGKLVTQVPTPNGFSFDESQYTTSYKSLTELIKENIATRTGDEVIILETGKELTEYISNYIDKDVAELDMNLTFSNGEWKPEKSCKYVEFSLYDQPIYYKSDAELYKTHLVAELTDVLE